MGGVVRSLMTMGDEDLGGVGVGADMEPTIAGVQVEKISNSFLLLDLGRLVYLVLYTYFHSHSQGLLQSLLSGSDSPQAA